MDLFEIFSTQKNIHLFKLQCDDTTIKIFDMTRKITEFT